jgi:hypothetical protein
MIFGEGMEPPPSQLEQLVSKFSLIDLAGSEKIT